MKKNCNQDEEKMVECHTVHPSVVFRCPVDMVFIQENKSCKPFGCPERWPLFHLFSGPDCVCHRLYFQNIEMENDA
jgi:hypothetical protein